MNATPKKHLEPTHSLSREHNVFSGAQFRLIVEHIDRCFQEKISTDDLARIAGFERRRFNRLFKTFAGMPPQKFIIKKRLLYVQLLRDKGMKAAAAADWAGFYDQPHYLHMRKKYSDDSP